MHVPSSIAPRGLSKGRTRHRGSYEKTSLKPNRKTKGIFARMYVFFFIFHSSLDSSGGNHVHRTEDHLPRKVQSHPQVMIKDTERTCVAPDCTNRTCESHQGAHFITCGAEICANGPWLLHQENALVARLLGLALLASPSHI
jgi:hypothetical protein